MDLEEVRKKIDLLDFRILKLLNDRMEQAILAGRLKSQIQDPEREQEILFSLKGIATLLVPGDLVEKVYSEVFQQSRQLQQQNHMLVAFQGDHGAYGEVAAKKWNDTLIPMPCSDFVQVFNGVESGFFDYGIVPVENTLGGIVFPVNELLVGTPLKIVGAVEFLVHHCLLSLPETDHREIRMVYSHPQALAQCRRFLARNKLEPMAYSDTAGAAKMLAERRPRASAAIASQLSADLYKLQVLKERIEDSPANVTRFVVLSKDDTAEPGDKCSVVFSTEHKAGTLFRVLEIFAKRGINLTRIESFPDKPGTYAFFVDFEGSRNDPTVGSALEEAESETEAFKLLGCYKEKRER